MYYTNISYNTKYKDFTEGRFRLKASGREKGKLCGGKRMKSK